MTKLRRIRRVLQTKLEISELEANAIVLAMQHASESDNFKSEYGEFHQTVVEGLIQADW